MELNGNSRPGRETSPESSSFFYKLQAFLIGRLAERLRCDECFSSLTRGNTPDLESFLVNIFEGHRFDSWFYDRFSAEDLFDLEGRTGDMSTANNISSEVLDTILLQMAEHFGFGSLLLLDEYLCAQYADPETRERFLKIDPFTSGPVVVWQIPRGGSEEVVVTVSRNLIRNLFS